MKILTTAVVFIGLTASAMAMSDSTKAIIGKVQALGFSDELVEMLSESELQHIGTIIHDGSDMDQRMAVRSAVVRMTLNNPTGFASGKTNDGSDLDQRMNLALKAMAPVSAELNKSFFDGEDDEQRRALSNN